MTPHDRFTDGENTGAPLVPDLSPDSAEGREETVLSHRLPDQPS